MQSKIYYINALCRAFTISRRYERHYSELLPETCCITGTTMQTLYRALSRMRSLTALCRALRRALFRDVQIKARRRALYRALARDLLYQRHYYADTIQGTFQNVSRHDVEHCTGDFWKTCACSSYSATSSSQSLPPTIAEYIYIYIHIYITKWV